MIESIFLVMLMFAIIINLLGWIINKKDMLGIVFLMIATMLWLGMIMTNSFFIQVPGDTVYQEYGLNVFCPMFIFINIAIIVYCLISSEAFTSWRENRNEWGG